VKRAEKARRIQAQLDERYSELVAPLSHEDPYTLLIAVLLSAQCTDARVNQVTPKLFARASTPEEMLKLSVDEIREIIRSCGLSPSKAKAIAELSQVLVDEYGGQVPRTFKELEALRGVGHKTASVVMIATNCSSTRNRIRLCERLGEPPLTMLKRPSSRTTATAPTATRWLGRRTAAL